MKLPFYEDKNPFLDFFTIFTSLNLNQFHFARGARLDHLYYPVRKTRPLVINENPIVKFFKCYNH